MTIEQTEFRPGVTGELITNLHRRLELAGIAVPADELADDHFGPGTEEAVRRFQAVHGLPAHGVVDPVTARGLGLGGFPTSITGLVCRPDGSALANVAVQLVQPGAGGDEPVGEARSGGDGKFTLPWPRGRTGGLVVRAEGGAEKALSWKAAMSAGALWVRLSVGGAYRGASRFALIDAEAAGAGAARGRDASTHALARALAARTKLDPEVVFALLTAEAVHDADATAASDDQRLDALVDRLLSRRRDDLRASLAAAAADNVVGALDVDAAADRLHALRIERLASRPLRGRIFGALADQHACCASSPDIPRDAGATTAAGGMHAAAPLQVDDTALRDLIATSVTDPAAQRRVLEAFAAHEADVDLPRIVDAADLPADQRAHLLFTLETAALVGNHLPLVARVQKLRAAGSIATTADLARLDEADWTKLLHEADPGAARTALPAPIGLAVAAPTDRVAHLARAVARRFEISHPTAALSGRLAKDAAGLRLAAGEAVQRFLDRAPGFCIRHTHIDRFVKDAALGVLPSGDERTQLVADLKTLQRAYKLTPRADHVKAMLAAGHTSAYSVYAAGPQLFSAQMTAAGATPREATAMFAQAEQVHATSLTLMANLNSAFTGATPLAVAQPVATAAVQAALASFPNLNSLFGPIDYCACADCRAIHGPASYLVDLLQFLNSRKIAAGSTTSLRDILIGHATDIIGRRPDLAQIELSCANTNGIVPYIDLVCEILEDAVAAPASGVVRARQTSGSDAELRANPAFVNDSAYSTLRSASFPISAPFDLYATEIRAFFRQIGVTWNEMMTALQMPALGGTPPAPTNGQIAGERFGFSASALSIVTTASPTSPWTLWNLAASNNTIPDPRITDGSVTKSGTWLQVLSYVPILLNRAMLQHRELIQLLQTRFCNPGGVLAVVEDASASGFATCDLGKQNIKLANGNSGDAWTADLLTRFNRFIRLWRQLGCTIWDLDKMICLPAIGNTAIDDNAITQLGLIDAIAARLPGPRDELLTLWGDIDHFDYLNVLGDPEVVAPSVYRRRFRNTTVTQASTAFPDDPTTLTGTLDDTAAVAGIAAALDISAADIARIRAAAALSASGTALNLGNLSAIARYAILADRLDMSISDLVTAIGVTGVNPFPGTLSPAVTLQFLTALDQVNSSGFTLLELDYLLRHGSVVDSGIGLADATIISWLEDLRRSLVRLASAGAAAAADLVVQRLGAALALDPTLTQQVLQATLPGGSSTIASLFTASAFTAQAADGTFTTATTRANFSALFDAYTALDKLRLVLARWKVSAADALWLVQHAAAAGWMQLHTLPANATAAQSSTVTLAQLDILRNNIVVQQTLASPSGVRLFDFALSPGATVADAAAKLAPLGNWLASDIAALAAQFRLTTAASLVAGATVARLRDAMAWPRKLGADVPTTLSYVTTAVDSNLSRKARQLAKSRFSNDQWLDVAARIQDGLREQKRAALVGWLLAHPDSSRGQKWVTVEDLYGFYLIDPEMSAVTDTTRVKQATASVQLFVQRCLMQLETNITADPADIGWKQWDWMKQFRLWEANRKIFLYPENWFDPTQRHDTSPYFEDLINDLQQTDLTNDIAEDALRAYLHKLADVAHLEVSGIWEQLVQNNNSILHVVARTRKTPYVYSYRRRESTLSWSPWEPVDAGVDTNPVMPVIWNNRLFLLWTEFTQKSPPTSTQDRTVPAANANPPAVANAPINYWEIALAWIERRNDLWMPKRLSQRKQLLLDWRRSEIVSRIALPANTRSLSVELYEPTRTTAIQAQWLLTSAEDEPLLTNAGDYTSVVSLDDRRYFGASPGTTRGGKTPRLAGTDMSYNFNANGGDNPGVTGALGLWKPDANGNEIFRTALSSITQPRVISARFIDADQFTSPFFISDPQRSFFAADSTWTLQAFYHPFVETFVQRLNIAGIPGLYDRQLQINPDGVRGTTAFDFNATYQPTSFVAAPFPTETIDYTQSGPYSVYNWELFLHAPLLIAKKLAANQRFDEALTWFHYIFNPTTVDNGSVPQRYWNPRVFRDLTATDYTAQQIEQLLQQVNAGMNVNPPPAIVQRVTDWRNNPFDPNLVAAARPVAYQKAVVMAYISTLIAWGDQLFRGNTIESINEATQLYILASQLLGPRPQNLRAIQPRQNKAYTDLSAQLDAFSSTVVDIENVVSVPPPGIAAGTGLPTIHTFYFCIPPNDQMLSFWDTVADRLFKVRHGLDINGVARPLSLFDAPIDPGVLVRAAAAGVDISAALADTAVTLMCYRFATLWQVAHDLCQDIRGLASALLGALERRDGEEMARLRATQEVAVLDAMTAVKTGQRDEAIANRDALQFSHQLAEARRDYYKSRQFKNDAEAQGLALTQGAIDLEYTGVHLDILAAVAALIPALHAGASGFGGSPHVTLQWGGENLSRNCSAAAGVLRGYANIRSQKAGMSNTLASYQRRADEWDFQRQLAETEITQIEKQQAAAELRIAIAQHELDVHVQQVADAKANAELLRTKFTNQELYDWMVSQLSATYFHAYQLAYDLAKRASKAYAFELGRPDPGFIQFGYWDNLHRGLVAGDKLLLDLRRLQTEHLNRNTREFELTKHISMLQLDPTALIALRHTGQCFFNLPESLFDLDQPGHFYRRLKTVSVTLPCVTGPYTSINATLTLLSHSTRIDNTVGSHYHTSSTDSSDGLPTDGRFSHAIGAVQQIALSTAREDAGLFEVNFHDERYLPFEGAGAISHWRLDLPIDTNQFDLQTLSDVVLHVRYTAREGGDSLRTAARTEVIAALPRGGVQLLSARTEFPDAYARLFAPTGAGQSLDLAIGPEHFPFVPTTQQVNIAKMTALLVFAADRTYTDYVNAGSTKWLPAHLGVTTSDGTPPTGTATFISDSTKFGGLPSAAVTLSGAAGPLSLAIVESELSGKFLDQVQTAPDGTSHHRLHQDLIEDILIVIDYQIVAKS